MIVRLTDDWLDELLRWERSEEYRALPLDYFTVKDAFMMARGDIIPLLELMVSDQRCREALGRMVQWGRDQTSGPFPRDALTLWDQFTNWYILKAGLRHRNSLYETVTLEMAKDIVSGDLDVTDRAAINRRLDAREEDFRRFVEGG